MTRFKMLHLLAREVSAGRLMFCFCYFFLFFNDCLEQRDLGSYKHDLHQIFRGGRHVCVDVQSGISFAIGIAMATNSRREIG